MTYRKNHVGCWRFISERSSVCIHGRLMLAQSQLFSPQIDVCTYQCAEKDVPDSPALGFSVRLRSFHLGCNGICKSEWLLVACCVSDQFIDATVVLRRFRPSATRRCTARAFPRSLSRAW